MQEENNSFTWPYITFAVGRQNIQNRIVILHTHTESNPNIALPIIVPLFLSTCVSLWTEIGYCTVFWFTATGVNTTQHYIRVWLCVHVCVRVCVQIYIYIHTHTHIIPGGMCQTSGECSLLYVHRYNPKHLYPKLNSYRDNGHISLKVWQLLHTYWLPNTY